MSDTAKLTEQRDRGAQAEALLKHPLLADVLQEMRDETIVTLDEALVDDVETLKDVQKMRWAIARFEGILKKAIGEGNAAIKQLMARPENQNEQTDKSA